MVKSVLAGREAEGQAGKMRGFLVIRIALLIACATCLTGCGTMGALGNAATGLGQTAMNLPRNLLGTANRVGKGITQSFMSSGRSALGMGPRVLSVPAR